ncbi:hypothetical protein AJ85_09555 [Alkalihalobacillus alcalophilus ATCC 27647 = CGMCC 1.3604]|uniref:Pilus assembly protein PilZ n=1 Tax=Alkalihalobacillus alcalophilus ATCC 27647 = CGMCC 1.3604 TaxID=1218173 RepID=A0A094WQU6_ALKAL|nr:PilZ domain-containing protein [Alkalihalobacillus alcalophilus]KGA99166.1 hypothetical protein BALCAV_0200480 [Alkalihalobacillus alcalophilus ATCC 27647 = CGMCC 1.3604]MED1562489.1 PilZ domain-containing protein [Alkalihalobacillus alcalophilus]THG90653.1 hypothetical protein AJ85_09555 [Alkalihalobacillus alcalophilus ATCC 27647 = CGMCC 1.3604]
MIEIGKSIYLELTEQSDMGKPKTEKFSSMVVDFLNQDLVIYYPISELTQKQSYFLKGTSFLVSYIGKDKAIYQFESEIIGRKIMQIPVLILKNAPLTEYKRIQRREYLRIKTLLDVTVTINEKTFATTTFDLSGGGCSFFIPIHEKLRPMQEVSLLIVLGKGRKKTIGTKAKIIRINSFNDRKQLVSCQFEEMPSQTREEIIQFCFKRQFVQVDKA